MLQNFSYLIDTYKESKNDQNLFIDTQSIHWDNHYKNNEKFLDKKDLNKKISKILYNISNSRN